MNTHSASYNIDRELANEYFKRIHPPGTKHAHINTFYDRVLTKAEKKDPAAKRAHKAESKHHNKSFEIEIDNLSDPNWDKLEHFNQKGAGAFCTINIRRASAKRRQKTDIRSSMVLALDVDYPQAVLDNMPLEPNLTVYTSGGKEGKYHEYYLMDEVMPEKFFMEEWEDMQTALNYNYFGDMNSCKVTQVMRVPGTWHYKDPDNPQQVKMKVNKNQPHYSYDELKEAVGKPPAPKVRKPFDQDTGNAFPVDENRTRDMLMFINSDVMPNSLPTGVKYRPNWAFDMNRRVDGRTFWVTVGFAIHKSGLPNGFKLWAKWSKRRAGYDGNLLHIWDSFGKRKSGTDITLASVAMVAGYCGWEYKPNITDEKGGHFVITEHSDVGKLFDQMCATPELTPDDVDKLIARMVDAGLGMQRSLKQTYVERKKRYTGEFRTQKILSEAGEKVPLEYKANEMESMAHQTAVAMVKVYQDKDPIMLFSGVPCWVKNFPVENALLHMAGDTGEELPAVPQIIPHSLVSIEHRIDRSVVLVKKDESGDLTRLPRMPEELKTHVLGSVCEQIPPCAGLVTNPVVARDGRIIYKDGFDAKSGLYIAKGCGIDLSDIADKRISKTRAIDAIELIVGKLFEEFEFDGEVSEEAAVAAYLTTVNRKVFGIVPGFLLDAAMPGTGKTTFVRMMSYCTSGENAVAMSWVSGEEEIRKRLMSVMCTNPAIVMFDNVPEGQVIKSETLSNMFTQENLKDRRLGQTEMVQVVNNATYFFTGNNITVDGDGARRIVPVRLSSDMERPENRSFKHPDVAEFAKGLRKEMLCAAITILRYGATHEMPDTPNSGFTQWDMAILRPLMSLGFSDFFNLSTAKNRETSQELQMLTELFATLVEAWPGEGWFTATDIANAQDTLDDDGDPTAKAKVYQLFQDRYDGIGPIPRNILGKYVNMFSGKISNGYRMEAGKDSRGGTLRFRIVKLGE